MSFLCDRKTTNVASNQPGFINFIVLPLFKQVTEILPEMDFLCQRAVENSNLWKEYVETEKDKQVYEHKVTQPPQIEAIDSDSDEDDSSDGANEQKK